MKKFPSSSNVRFWALWWAMAEEYPGLPGVEWRER